MKIEGGFTLAAPQRVVWEKIRDPALVAGCLPGCEKVAVLSPTSYQARIVVAIGPIRAAFDVVVEVTKEEPPERVLSTTRGEEGTRASVLSTKNVVTLATLPDGSTRVSYVSDVSITGRLGRFGLGVMKKKADALAKEFANAFQMRLEATGD